MTDVVGVARGRDHDQEGCEDHRHESDEEQDCARQGEEPVDVSVAVVAALDSADDLWYQDRVEDAGGQEVEHGVG